MRRTAKSLIILSNVNVFDDIFFVLCPFLFFLPPSPLFFSFSPFLRLFPEVQSNLAIILRKSHETMPQLSFGFRSERNKLMVKRDPYQKVLSISRWVKV